MFVVPNKASHAVDHFNLVNNTYIVAYSMSVWIIWAGLSA
jgi:hypothetical protein